MTNPTHDMPTPITGTVGYSVKCASPIGEQYGNQEGVVYVPFDASDPYGQTLHVNDIAKNADRAFAQAKEIVYKNLGIEYEVFSEDGEHLTVTPVVSAAPKAQNQVQQAPAGDRKPSGSTAPTRSPKILKALENVPPPEVLYQEWARLVSEGKIQETDDEVWDQRRFVPQFGGTSKPNAPWFRTKAGQVPLLFGGKPSKTDGGAA